MAEKRRVIVKPSQSGTISPGRMKKVVRSVHIVPASKGWVVKQGGKAKSNTRFSTKRDAVRFGKELSRSSQTGMFIHSKDGKVQEVNSFGSDPYPPREATDDQ